MKKPMTPARARISAGRKMSRRSFLKSMAYGATALTSSQSVRVWGAGPQPYGGKLLVTLQLDGGADVTQLCDPKVNTPGERVINHWAESADPGQQGNLLYAPVADNANLFRRFGSNMLVVNGVDAQTNSHETGKLFNWTGSNAEGKPSITALHAAAAASEQPLAYSVFGGASRTAGIITYNRFDDVSRLRELAEPNAQPWDPETSMRPEWEVARAQALVDQSANAMLADPTLTPRQYRNLINHQIAREGRDSLATLADLLPNQDEFQQNEDFQVGDFNFWSNLKQQMQGALLVFKSGLGAAADMSLGGFDSHEQHDMIHDALYTHLADCLYFFWDYAEELGIADRITLVVGSDFGRTNMYNDGNGKDHWNVGSYMIMESGARWGNRVVGASDELHFAHRINPSTLQISSGGIVMTPAHVHKALRRYLGLEGYAQSLGLGMASVENLPLFEASKQTSV